MIRTHRPPTRCPVCSTSLITLRLGCPNCATELSGHFDTCRFCRLDAADAALLEVFLRSRGNLRDVQAHLGVSYPTARARLGEVLDRLGMGEPTPPAPPVPPAPTRAPGTPPAAAPPAAPDRVAAILADLAAGRTSPAQAEAALLAAGLATPG